MASTVVGLVLAVASTTASYLLAKRAQKKQDEAAIEMTGPLTKVNQGSYIPYLVGRRRLGVLYAWTGRRIVRKLRDSSLGQGKGGSIGKAFEAKRPHVFESGFLPVCVGPALQLHQIFYGGEGTTNTSGTPVNPTTFPNAAASSILSEFFLLSRLDLDPYQIFWGFVKQEFNSAQILGPMGTASRWPGICYLVMNPRLGRTPQWNVVECDITVGINDTGTVALALSTPFISSAAYSDGAPGLNGAHIMAQLLFGGFPYGLGLDPALFDIPSLETLGQTLETEGILSAVLGEKGETFQALIAQLMQDLGFMISWDVIQGKYIFELVRPSGASVPTIPTSIQNQGPPEIIFRHDAFVADRIMFKFLDFDRRYRPTIVSVDSDGQILVDVFPSAAVVIVPTANDLVSARLIAERRSQESFGGENEYRITLARNSAALYPGRLFFLSGLRALLRVLTIKHDPLTGQVKIKAVEDAYGAAVDAAYTAGPDPTEPAPLTKDVSEDDIVGLYEVPLFLLTPSTAPRIQVPRIRNHDQIVLADIWISDDNVTYSQLGSSQSIQTGGSLDTGLAAGTDQEVEAGPDVFLFGPPDDNVIQDLSANEDLWRAGEQVVLINEEIMFVREVVAKGGGGGLHLDGLA